MASGNGRLVHGSVNEGLLQLNRKLPADTYLDRARFFNGRKLYKERGFNLLCGDEGWGYYGLNLPWGQHPDIDYILEAHGHRRT
jgi:hypothetical protein